MFRSQGKLYIKKKERPKAGQGEIENPFAACRQRCPYLCAAQAPFLLWASYTIFALSCVHCRSVHSQLFSLSGYDKDVTM